jgi:hypothetical protein
MALNKKDEIELAIADIKSALNSGATSHSSDGQSTSWDQDALRRRLVELENELDEINGNPPSRPFFYSINLNTGGAE